MQYERTSIDPHSFKNAQFLLEILQTSFPDSLCRLDIVVLLVYEGIIPGELVALVGQKVFIVVSSDYDRLNRIIPFKKLQTK